ncbi:hypothetical protein ACEN2I_05630 [Flavobacterium sp. W22_SRS_FK3]|uniref:hypothetical protein n=1 Tax=Flavobacterium sp. W22_SRS_FK3 TaxID=3240275 RepID=UPI003F930B58
MSKLRSGVRLYSLTVHTKTNNAIGIQWRYFFYDLDYFRVSKKGIKTKTWDQDENLLSRKNFILS